MYDLVHRCLVNLLNDTYSLTFIKRYMWIIVRICFKKQKPHQQRQQLHSGVNYQRIYIAVCLEE